MTSVNVTTTKNTVTVNGETRVVTVKTRGPQGPSLPDGDKGDVTVSSNGTAISINNSAVTSAKIADGAIVNADINASAAIALSKLATGALPTAITVTSANISDLSIVNADINASAAIAGTKISPDFGSQDITTTGRAIVSAITINDGQPGLIFEDTTANPDFILQNRNGVFAIRDITSNVNRFLVNAANGDVTVTGTVDGRDVATDGTKLDGIETGATADQTASEIKTLLNSDGIVNAQIDASAAIAGTKISPDFGSQNITTTGTLTTQGTLTIGGTFAQIFLQDSNNNPDYRVQNSNGTFIIKDDTNSVNRFRIASNGNVSITNNLNAEGGLDVTGNITVSGTVDGVDIAALNTTVGNLSLSGSVLADGTTATTQSASDNSTKVATTAYTDTAIANLVDSAPGTLNTLNELAAALGDDANFSTTVTNSIATKLPLAGGTLTGNLTLSSPFPKIIITDTNNDSDFEIANANGLFRFRDITNSTDRLTIASNGRATFGNDVGVDGNLDVGNGLDVTGNITVTGTVDGRDIATDGTKLDGIESNATADQTASEIVALVADQTIAPSEIDMEDNEKIKLGTGDDLQIYHDGTNSHIDNVTNRLFIRNNIAGNTGHAIVLQALSGETSVNLMPHGTAELMYDASKKLETTSTGVTVTGGVLIGDTTSMSASAGSGVLEVARTGGAKLMLRRNDTSIGPSDIISQIEIAGNDPDGSTERIGGLIEFSCPSGQAWNTDDYPTHISFKNCKDGSGTPNTSLFISGNPADTKHNVLIGDASGSNMNDYYLGIKGNENSSNGDTGNSVNFGILNQSTSSAATSTIDFRLGQASLSNAISVRLTGGKGGGWTNTASTRDGYFAVDVIENAQLVERLRIRSNGNVQLPGDNAKLQIGASQDLELYHNGSNNSSFIDNTTGDLTIRGGGGDIIINPVNTETAIYAIANDKVQLRFDNSTKLETTSTGVSVTGDITGTGNLTLTSTDAGSSAAPELELYRNSASPADADYLGQLKFTGEDDAGGKSLFAKITAKIDDASSGSEDGILEFTLRKANVNNIAARFTSTDLKLLNGTGLQIDDDNAKLEIGASQDLKLYHNGTDSFIENATGKLNLKSYQFFLQSANGSEDYLKATHNYGVELYFDNSKKFETTTSGARFTSSRVQFHNSTSSGSYAQFSNSGTGHGSTSGLWVGANSSNQGIIQNKENTDLRFYTNDTERFKIESGGDVRITGDKGLTLGANNDLAIAHDGSLSRLSDTYGHLKVASNLIELTNQSLGETYIKATNNAAVEFYYDNSKKLETTSTGSQTTGMHLIQGHSDIDNQGNPLLFLRDSTNTSTKAVFLLEDDYTTGRGALAINVGESGVTNDRDLMLQKAGGRVGIRCTPTTNFEVSGTSKFNGSITGNDNIKIKLGTGEDLQIYHDGTNNYIEGNNQKTIIRNTANNIHLQAKSGEAGIDVIPDSSVRLYFDNSKKFETLTNGVHVTGTTFLDDSSRDDGFKAKFGTGDDLQIFHDGSHSYIADVGTGNLSISSSAGEIQLAFNDFAGNFEHMVQCNPHGSVNLYYDNSKKLETTSTGVSVTGRLIATDRIQTQQAGIASLRAGSTDASGAYLYLDGDSDGNFSGSDYSYVAMDDLGRLRLLSNNPAHSGDILFSVANGSGNSETAARMIGGGAVNLYFDHSKKFETTNAGVDVTGSLSVANHITLPDQASGVGKIKMGDNVDFQIYHNGTHSVLENRTGSLLFYNNTNELAARFVPNGAVDLYYDNSKKLETQSSGVEITGKLTFATEGLAGGSIDLGIDADLNLYHDNSDAFIDNNTGDFYIRNDGNSTSEKIRIQAKGGEQSIIASPNGAVELYHDNSKKFNTSSTGVFITGSIDIGGQCLPTNDHSGLNLGSSSLRWTEVFAANGSINTSDKNEKNTIVESDLGLDFINKLKPVSYKWNKDDGKTHYGLIAQDIEEIITSLGKTVSDFGSIDKPKDAPMGLNYSQFFAPLIKAVQELSAKVEMLETKVATLEGG